MFKNSIKLSCEQNKKLNNKTSGKLCKLFLTNKKRVKMFNFSRKCQKLTHEVTVT